LLAPASARALGSIKTDLDRTTAKVGEEFTLTFSLPPDCPYVDVPLPKSDLIAVVSKDFGQAGKFALVKLNSGSSNAAPQVQRGIARSSGSIVYVLRAVASGKIQFEPIRVRCGASFGETFRREILVVADPLAAPGPAAPPPEDVLTKTAALQNLVGSGPSERQLLDSELSGVKRSTQTLTDLAYNEGPDRGPQGAIEFIVWYYNLWMARLAKVKKIWTLEAFGVPGYLAPYLVGGAFLAVVLSLILGDQLARYRKRKAAEAALPQVNVRRPTLPKSPGEGPS
jgi:hypothetical protein